MVSRERDSYYEELVTQVQQSSLVPFHPTAVAVSTPAPGYTAPASSSVLATATLPAPTNPPVQYAPPSAAYPTQPVQQHPQLSLLHQQQTQPAPNPPTGLSAYGADPPTPFLQGMLSASSPAPLYSASMTPSPLSVPHAQQQVQGSSPLQTPGVGISQVPITPASGSGDPWWARAATLPSVLGPSASAAPPGLGCSHVSTPSIGCNMASA
eukprot:3151157-Amphidinium_carterae.1